MPSPSQRPDPDTGFISYVRGQLADRHFAVGLLALLAFAIWAATWWAWDLGPVEIVGVAVVTALIGPTVVLPREDRERFVIPLIGTASVLLVGSQLWEPLGTDPFELLRVVMALLLLTALAPLPGRSRDAQLLALTGVVLAAVATGRFPPNHAAQYTLTIAFTILSGWAIAWLTERFWHQTWQNHTRLRTLSSELSKVGVELRGAIDTTRRDLQRQHHAMMEQDRLATLGRLAVGIGHEINNPLTVALTNIDLARAEFDPELLDDAKIALVRIKNIVQDLSRIARPEADNATVTVHHLDQVFVRALAVARMGLKSLSVEVEEMPDAPIRVVRGRLEQVLTNLLVNAWHAVGDQPRGRVRIRFETNAEYVHILIEDNGSGIDPDHTERVFEPFFTTKSANRGTGLGLALSRSYLRAMGGDVTAGHSRDLGGALLTLRLQRADDKEDVVQLTSRTTPPKRRLQRDQFATIPPGDKAFLSQPSLLPTLLVVDDEPALRRSLKRSLRHHWNVFAVAGSREAVEVAQRGRINAVLCDLVLNNEDAIDVLTALGAVQANVLQHTLLMTGEPTTGRMVDFARRNTLALVRKPFDLEELNDRLNRAIGGVIQKIDLNADGRDIDTAPHPPRSPSLADDP